jgi:hypothetical protein
MSKKIMLLALAVASFAMFALPAAASAQEIHLENVTKFSGSAGAGSLAGEGEPTITCESGDVDGTVSAGGTTGTINLDFTGCHATVFGLTAKCRTSGSALDNTIKTAGTFHLITIKTGVPGILVTTETVTIICAGISNTIVHGTVIGTITDSGKSVTCSRESTELTTSFAPTAGSEYTQEHETYTGVSTYDLTATTGEGGAAKTAALKSHATVKSETKGKLNCT